MGVSWHHKLNKYQARITFGNKSYYLGIFEKEEDAKNIYQKAVEQGEQYCINLLTNRKSNKTSKYKGVSFHKASNKFVAQATINGKRKHLGTFDTEELAYQAILNNK